MSPTERIIDKLKKIQAHADSAREIGNIAEAQAFAEMFERLLTRHKINMSDIDFEKLDVDEPVENNYIDFSKYPDFKVKRSAVQWQSVLAQIVAKAHYCDIVRWTGSNKFYIVGRRSDAEVAEYAIITLIRAAGKIARKEYGTFYRKCISEDGHPHRARGFHDAFLLGFVNRIDERYKELAAKTKSGETSMALVRIERERKAVEDFMKKEREAGSTKALQSRKTWRMNEDGRRRGRELADSINLQGKAVGGKAQGQLS